MDSVREAGQLVALRYEARDTSLSTRQLSIQFDPASDSLRVSRVDIISRTETALSASHKKLQYDPLVGYTIEAQQSGTMTEDLQFKLEAVFEKRN